MPSSSPQLSFDKNSTTLVCSGDWTLAEAKTMASYYTQFIDSFKQKTSGHFTVDGSKVTQLDSVGVWWLERFLNFLGNKGAHYTLSNFSSSHQHLLTLITEKIKSSQPIPTLSTLPWVANLGKNTVTGIQEIGHFISFIGETAVNTARLLRHPSRIPWRILFNLIQNVGYNALPIVGLLSFLIGIVLAYQMGQQLRSYGANIYVVDLLGLSVLREFAPMMTAIIIAGRSGSAFTAQLGTMKVNQEIDALSTLGINPIERLAVPKLLALLIALPLLTVWADITGIVGGMIMAQAQLNIDFTYFMHRFTQNIPLKWYVIGLIKTPVYAALIATIGCFQGLNVEANADSVGANTTKSVVEAIFMIITFDALFSILLSWLKI